MQGSIKYNLLYKSRRRGIDELNQEILWASIVDHIFEHRNLDANDLKDYAD